MSQEYECSECPKKVVLERADSLLKLGWAFVSLTGGSLGWICPECIRRHEKIIRRIQERYGLKGVKDNATKEA